MTFHKVITTTTLLVMGAGALAGCASDPAEELGETAAKLAAPIHLPIPNPAGASATTSTTGEIALDGPFFAKLGTNGRACDDCHALAEGWTVTPAGLRLRFAFSGGLAPVFRANDGATSPLAPVGTLAERRAAYATLLSRGTFRIGLPMPPAAEFDLVAVDDPYGYASSAELSLFRRPLPSTNLGSLTSVMWDGREGPAAGDDLLDALGHQATGATLGHAQAAAAPTPTQLADIVAFEASLTTAQVYALGAGPLDRHGAAGGLAALEAQPLEAGPMTLFDAWADQPSGSRRAAIARGQALFNTARDRAGGTCLGCHNVANVGGRLDGRFFNVAVSKPALRSPAQPLYTFANRTTGELRQTTDPGRALVTGKWADMDRFKVPGLRGLAARPPYFHDGSSATLDDVVRHYERELGFVFTDGERADLVAFLAAL